MTSKHTARSRWTIISSISKLPIEWGFVSSPCLQGRELKPPARWGQASTWQGVTATPGSQSWKTGWKNTFIMCYPVVLSSYSFISLPPVSLGACGLDQADSSMASLGRAAQKLRHPVWSWQQCPCLDLSLRQEAASHVHALGCSQSLFSPTGVWIRSWAWCPGVLSKVVLPIFVHCSFLD